MPDPARKYMPQPDCREAPKFKNDEPSGLIRFLERMEELWKECSINDDRIKVKTVGRYADPQSESEWKALTHFENGTWNEFKTELISSYPEAIDQVEGSLPRLREVCRANPRIGVRDEAPLKKLKREFMAQATRLLLIKPPIISNRELVEHFYGCLDENFRHQINSRLSLKGIDQGANITVAAATGPAEIAAAAALARRKGDKYDLDQVIAIAIDIVEGASSFLVSDSPLPTQIAVIGGKEEELVTKLEMEEIKQSVLGITERIEKTEKKTLNGLEGIMKALQQQNSQPPSHQASYPNNTQPPRQRTSDVPPRPNAFKCHYCFQPGHFIMACPEKQKHFEEGKIKTGANGTTLTLSDGTYISREPENVSLKDKVDEYHAKKVASFFYGEVTSHPIPGVLQLHQGASYDREKDEKIAQLQRDLAQFQAQQLYAPSAAPTNAQLQNQGFVNTNYSPVQAQASQGHDPAAVQKQMEALMNQVSALTSSVTQLAQNKAKDSGFN